MYEKYEAASADLDNLPVLSRSKTFNFLNKGLHNLAEGYECLGKFVEGKKIQIFSLGNIPDDNILFIYIESQIPFFFEKKTYLEQRRTKYFYLDASRPWLVYWILHSLELLKEELSIADKRNITNFLAR